MSNCNITIKLGKNGVKTFTSDEELDQYLAGHSSELNNLMKWYKIKSIEDFDNVFSMTEEQDTAVRKVNDIIKAYNEADATIIEVKDKKSWNKKQYDEVSEEYEEVVKINRSLSVSKSVEIWGRFRDASEPVIPGYNVNPYHEFLKKELRAQGKTEEEIKAILKKDDAKTELSARLGDDIHYIFACKFQQISDPSVKIDFNKLHVLTENDYNTYNPIFDKIVENVKAAYPNAKYYTELGIVSQTLSPGDRNILKNLGHDVDTINGRIDLLIIDENGIAHVIDWKTSSKRVGSWTEQDNKILRERGCWSTTKRVKAFGQVGNYGAMLEQYGLTVGNLELVPLYVEFKLDEDGWPDTEHPEVTTIQADSATWGKHLSCLPGTHKKLQEAEWHFAVTKPIEIKKLKKVNDELAFLFPGTNIHEEHVKHFEATINFYKTNPNFVKPVQKGTSWYEDGYRYVFYQKDLPSALKSGENGAVLSKNEEELEANLAQYVKDVQDYVNGQMTHFAEDLHKVIVNGGNDPLLIETWLSSFNEGQQNYLKNEFRKYYTNGWQVVVNPELNSNGIFIFKKNDKIDMICITEKDVHHVVPITHTSGKLTHNILGSKLLDNAEGTDPLFTMNSQWGNIVLMKMMAIIAANPEIFGDAKISLIKTINPWHQSEVPSPSNKILKDNWNRLVALHPDKNLNRVNDKLFLDDIDVWVDEAAEAMLSENISEFADILAPEANQQYRDIKYLQQLKTKIRISFPTEYKEPDTKAGYAYVQLCKAILAISGVYVLEELDRGKYFNNGLFPTGTEISNFALSKSSNARMIQRLFAYYRDSYTKIFTEDLANPMARLCDEVYKEWGVSERITSPQEFWKNFLEKDSKGNVLPEMLLCRPDNPIFVGKPKSQEFVRMFADKLAQFRFKNKTEEQLMRIKETDEYWQVPLVPARFGQYVRDSIKKNGFVGFCKGMWQKVKDMAQEAEEYYSGKKEWADSFTNNLKENDVVYNRYLDISQEQRGELIHDEDQRVWETDLRTVFMVTAERAAVSLASQDFGPKFSAFLTILNYSKQIGKMNIKELNEAINDWVKNKVYLRQIRDTSLEVLHKFLKVIKKGSSIATLALSTRNLAKETLVSAYVGATRTATHLVSGVSAENFAKAFHFVVQYQPTSIKKIGFLTYLNQIYGMSNYGYTDMADYMRRTLWGARNMTSGDLFVGTKIPDDYYRLTMLVAKLMQDGVFEAYVKDGETWKYDVKKDKRFTKYLNNDRSDPKEYIQQKALYDRFMQQWKIAYPDREIDTLPEPYPPTEKDAIRIRAGQLWGYFDTEDKSLLCSRFLGSAFMQYKTWMSAKLSQHIQSPGFVNIWQWHFVKDDQGNNLYLVAATQDELNSGDAIFKVMKESDPELEKALEEGRAVPWMMEEGTFQEGMVQATGEFLKAILTWDLDAFKKVWENPVKRGQLANGLMDTLGLLLFAGLIKLLFGEEVTKNKAQQDWVTQWTYGVLMGFAQDGPIHQVLGSMALDLNPPSLLALKQWANTANSVLAGSKSLGQGLVSTFGATRELQGYFYSMV